MGEELKTIELQLKILNDNHLENKEKLDYLTTTIHAIDMKLAAMPCREHKIKMATYDDHIKHGILWRISLVGVAFTLGLSILGFGVAWGQLREKVDSHIIYIEKSLSQR